MGLCFFYSCSLSRLGFDWRGNVSSLLCHSHEEEDSGMEGGLVGYMQINSLGAGRAGLRDCGTGMGGAVNITVRATTALFSHLILNSIDAHLCFSLSLSLTQSLASLFFFRTLALNLNSGSLGVSLL